MNKIIPVPQEVVNEIQRYDVEMCSRRDLISFMISKDMDISTEKFKQYQNEYSKAYFAFEQAKHNIEFNYVNSNMQYNEKKISWKLDYNTCELKIIYEEV